MAPCKAPDRVVSLKRGLRAEHHPSYAAELPRPGVVELGNRERTVQQAVPRHAFEAHARAADGIGVRALRRKVPRLLEELRMVDVEVVVDVVVARAHKLVGDRVPPARHVCEQDPRPYLVTDELRHPLGEGRFKVREEERERAVLPRVLPGVARDFLSDVAVEVRRLGAAGRQPFAPLLFESFLAREELISVVAEVALVDQREERERRFVRPAAPRLRVHVAEEVPGELEVVAEHTLVEERELLELAHPDRTVAVDAARAPLDAARDEEVRRQVYSVPDAGVE